MEEMVKIMNIKLSLLSIWTPKFIIIKELERTVAIINEHLDRIIMDCSINPPKDDLYKGNLDDMRTSMAQGHNKRVKILMDVLGKEKAYKLSKEAMFNAGLVMGQRARKLLGVRENIEDTIKAAKILYRILGIDFYTENKGNNIILWVTSCALSSDYTPETCCIMSYADKGVLKGLNKNLDLNLSKESLQVQTNAKHA